MSRWRPQSGTLRGLSSRTSIPERILHAHAPRTRMRLHNMILRLALVLVVVGATVTGRQEIATAQDRSDADEVAQAIGDAVAHADARLLSDLSSGQVELDLGDGTSVYSSDQARYVFASFFDDHPPSHFDLGEVNELRGTCTARGRYLSIDTNQPWDVFMRLSYSTGAWRLKELRLTRSFQLPTPVPSPLQPRLPPR